MKKLLLHSSQGLINFAYFLIRMGIGIIFIIHGFPKLIGGPEKWAEMGTFMQNIGVYIFPVFWGLMAGIAEFFGGIFLSIGFLTRLAALGVGFVMVIALLHHVNKGDPYMVYSHPLSLLVVLGAIFIAGAGKYSVDNYLPRK